MNISFGGLLLRAVGEASILASEWVRNKLGFAKGYIAYTYLFYSPDKIIT